MEGRSGTTVKALRREWWPMGHKWEVPFQMMRECTGGVGKMAKLAGPEKGLGEGIAARWHVAMAHVDSYLERRRMGEMSSAQTWHGAMKNIDSNLERRGNGGTGMTERSGDYEVR